MLVLVIMTVLIAWQFDVASVCFRGISFFFHAIFNAFRVTDYPKESTPNQRDILSMLQVVLGIIAIVSAGAYVVIYEVIKKRLKIAEEKMRHYTTAQALKMAGVLDYNRYLIKLDGGIEDKSLLEMAEKYTEKGVRSAMDLCALDGRSDHEELILCILKNNMAWFIYKKKEVKRRYEMLEHINYAIARAEKYPDHADVWFDTKKKIMEEFFSERGFEIEKPPTLRIQVERVRGYLCRKVCKK